MEKEEDQLNNFEIGEQIDCKDTVDKWLNAEIISKRATECRVHYTQWSTKYDEWISIYSDRMLKQWRKGQPIKINNRIDVQYQDKEGRIKQWLEALVEKIDEEDNDRIFVHFIDYKRIYDQWVNLKDESRVAEVGTYSKAHGRASLEKNNPKYQKIQKEFIQILKKKEKEFKSDLKNIDFEIYEVEGDGNCLFRAISHQIYGTEKYHQEIRNICLDYIMINKNYFKDFIIGGVRNFEDYIQWKRSDKVWGDNLEIQALREIYERPIQIYAYSNEPMRTFSEIGESQQHEPIRLSYHGQCHYNSIVTKKYNNQQSAAIDEELPAENTDGFQLQNNENQNQNLNQNQIQFGYIEEQAINKAKERQEEMRNQEQQSRNQGYNQEIGKARKDFEKIGMWNMDEAIKESFNLYSKKQAHQEEKQIEQAMKNDAIYQVEQLIDQETQNTIKQSANTYEDEIVKQAQLQSLKEAEEKERAFLQQKYYQDQLDQVMKEQNQLYETDIDKVLKESMKEYEQGNNQYQQQNIYQDYYQDSDSKAPNFMLIGDPMENQTILQVLNNDLNIDISLREAIRAYEIYGENPQQIISHICEQKLM
ncbi:Chromo domain protein [Pseudocohnilembus persalinus]|uniref:Chromo domain protein n=1 Tax=Pseudocohnilembus persalinus TaxID=266149 RepID=A0A0V0QHA7_PSEPJ|nr:Chromo domain protein [Pseudocohnilembus persalinus]|eukprot:KRX01602.1 Chromo domain protein [Pseudocohnilembus persalinus]